MGIWVENFALPAVINECLMHGHSGTIQLFPNWPCGDASFRDLRAAGGLLISATRKNNSVMEIQIRAESGGLARIHNPWQCALIHSPGMEPRVVKDRLVEIDMPAGGICILVELQGA